MLWFKRILPFALILIGWFGYRWYNDYQLAKIIQDEEKYAEATALIWVATAKYRNEPELFVNYRDSVLTEYNINIDKVDSFLEQYKSNPEYLGPFANLISEKVDSLVALEDSTFLDEKKSYELDDEE